VLAAVPDTVLSASETFEIVGRTQECLGESK